MNVLSNIIDNSQKVEAIQSPSTDEQINKMWQIHTAEYYSAIERNGLPIPGTKWTNLENKRRRGATCKSYILCMNVFIGNV